MKQKNLWLTVGIPGSGKSYFVNNGFTNLTHIENPRIVSRDEIRFRILDETNCTDYFGKEGKVWVEYVDTIQKYLDDEEITDIIADATHLNKKSREKLLSNFNLDNININFIVATTSLETCLYRNSKRKGRAHVPKKVIIDMYKKAELVFKDELNKYNSNQIIIFDKRAATLIKKGTGDEYDICLL